MLAAALSEHAAHDTAFQVEEGVLDVMVRQAVSRMITHCELQPDIAKFLARGLVIDSLGDVATQVRDYFPSHINVDAIIDDVSFVVAENAKSSNQRFQEVTLSYVADGQIPESSQANLQSFVKWYSTENILGGDYDKHQMKLNPGWGGGAGEPAAMLKELRLGTKKGFLLEVKTLDIKDAKARELMADMPMIQAFGGNAGAISAAADAISGGGEAAKDVQAIIDQIVEIKTLKAALNNAGDTPEAANIAVALAAKTETFNQTVETHTAKAQTAEIQAGNTPTSNVVDIKTVLPSAVLKVAATVVKNTSAQIQARQMAQAVNVLATALPPAIVARAANDGGAKAATVVAIAKLVQEIKTVAATQGLPVRDVIAISMMSDAPRNFSAPVEKLTQTLSQPNAVENLTQSLPPRIAETVHTTLTQPAAQQVIQTPVNVEVVANTIAAVAQKIENPTLQIAAQVVQETVTQGTEVQAVAPALQAQTLQSVVDNIQALQISNSIPANAKPALQIIEAQLQTAIAQTTVVAPQAPATPITISRDAPLGALQETFKIEPTPVPPTPKATIETPFPTTPKGVGMPGIHAANTNTVTHTPAAKTETTAPTMRTNDNPTASPFSNRAASSIADAIQPDAKADTKNNPTAKGKCANCFGDCASCGAGSALAKQIKVEAAKSTIRLSDIKTRPSVS